MKSHVVSILVFLAISSSSNATHLRGGYISVKQLSASPLQVRITIIAYTNASNTTVVFGGDQSVVDFGDGVTGKVPETPSVVIDGYPGNIKMATYSVVHTYSAPGFYVVSYREPNRNEGIINIANSVNTLFYIEAGFSLDPSVGSYSSPEPFHHPIFIGYLNSDFSSSLASEDLMGSQLVYSLTTPLANRNTLVQNFKRPASVRLNRSTGLLMWDNLYFGTRKAGEYLYAARVDQYKLINNVRKLIGYSYRDFQIILLDEDLDGRIRHSEEKDEIVVSPGSSSSIKVFISHLSSEVVSVDLKTDLDKASYSLTEYDSVSTTTGTNIRVASITLKMGEDLTSPYGYVIAARGTFQENANVYFKDTGLKIFTHEPTIELDPVQTIGERRSLISVCPNPTSGLLNVKGIDRRNHRITLYSSNGKLMQFIEHPDSGVLDVSHLNDGLYILLIKDRFDKILFSSKIIKR